MKKISIKKAIALVAAVILTLGLAACGSEPEKVGETKSSSSTSNASKSDSGKARTFKVGDVVQLKNYKVTVNKIRTDNGGEVSKPKDGNVFFYVDCTIENISKEEQTVSSILMFKVRDADGRSLEQAIPEHQNGELDGKVAAGQKLSGEYVVEAPKDKTGLKLVFDGSLFGGKQVIVQLN